MTLTILTVIAVPIQDTAYETRVTLINESGLYELILSSKQPQAKAFKRWVTKRFCLLAETAKINYDFFLHV
jgi:prophage antirepressor-like protein